MTGRLAASIVLALLAGVVTPAATVDLDRLATYQLGRGWATFGLALPQGAARGAVAVGTLPTQTDVKTRWPDGSIRFAVVTARALGAEYHLTAVSGIGPRSVTSAIESSFSRCLRHSAAGTSTRASWEMTRGDSLRTVSAPISSAYKFTSAEESANAAVTPAPV